MPLQSQGFAVTTAVAGHTGSIALTGEFDLDGEPGALAALDQALAADPGIVVIDLSGLDFIDSTGLRWLIGARARCLEEGRRLLVVPGPAQVRRVLVMCDLEDLFELVPSVAATAELIPLPVASQRARRPGGDGIADTA